ncbi:MAG: hypothetical protein JSR48_07075 [Verrucomicrobia bacterium]|nr:hypothetical protein [Verrucomicrobiota bacterium]
MAGQSDIAWSVSSSPPLLSPTGAPRHHWKFFRTGGLDQVALTTSADLLALDQLDPKLWVALSCPVKGLELDEKTLALIDADGDGRIRVPELLTAVKWAADRLKDPATLLRGADRLPLAVMNDATPEGKVIHAAARQILLSLGRPDEAAIGVDDTSDVAKIFSASALNGDGVIPLEATEDADARGLIQDAVACMGGVADRTGSIGTTAEKTEAFYKELEAYVAWVEQGSAQGIAALGDQTAAACGVLQAVRVKVEDYFARCRLAAFDARAIAALNRSETEYLAIAARDLKITTEEVAGFPLARVEAGRALPLLEGVNPAWAAALAALHATVVTPLLGGSRKSLTEEEWRELNARLAPFEAWLGSKAGAKVESLGLARARELLAGKGRETLQGLIARDQALAPEFNAISAVDRLVRYHRDLRALLHNFVNFADFYSPDRLAVFQAGTLYIDSRSCELCIRVDDPGAHAGLAASSKAYIAYIDCRRPSGELMKVAACVTQGDSDYLVTGRNGLFIDRRGRDWDATITKIIDNPISLRQAFWSPYKKFIRMIEEQVAKRAAAADAEANTKLATTAESAANADKNKAAAKKIDVGTVAALGVAVGAIGGALATLATGLAKLEPWQLPLVIVAGMLIISTPAVVIAWLKLRQRTLGPILDANGWAVNGRVQINIPFGTALTEQASLPPGASRSLKDPYAEKKGGRRTVLVAVIVLVILLGLAKLFGVWPFGPFFGGSSGTPAVETMN